MDFPTIFIIWGVVVLVIIVIIARLAIRWIVRLIIVGIILIALVGVGIFWWWTNRLTSNPRQDKPRSAPTRRASSN